MFFSLLLNFYDPCRRILPVLVIILYINVCPLHILSALVAINLLVAFSSIYKEPGSKRLHSFSIKFSVDIIFNSPIGKV